jgi:hypothetical protein
MSKTLPAQHHRAAVAAQHEKDLLMPSQPKPDEISPGETSPGAIGGVGGHPSGVKAKASMRRL